MNVRFHQAAKAVTLLAPSHLFVSLVRAEGIQVNRTCEFSSCASTNTLAEAGTIAEHFSFVYTFANSDRYQATGTFGAYNSSNSTGSVGIDAAQVELFDFRDTITFGAGSGVGSNISVSDVPLSPAIALEPSTFLLVLPALALFGLSLLRRIAF